MKKKISKLVKTGFYKEALSLFSNHHFQSKPLTKFTFPFLLKSCSKLKLFSHGQMLHAHITKTGFGSDIYTATSLTDMYVKFQFLDNALKVFDEMPEPNTTLINVFISGFSQNGCYEECLDVFRRFSEFKLRPDSATISSLLTGCEIGLKDGIQVHCWAVKIGVEEDIYVATSLVTMYFDCKVPETASVVFKRIGYKNVACYNAFFSGLFQSRIPEQVIEVFKEMLKCSDENPNTVTYVSVLSACSDFKNLKFGRQIHGLVIKVDLILDLLIGTALLEMYSKCGYWHFSYDIFKDLRGVRSLVTWNSMISGMMLNNESENAIGLFTMLESDKLKPDSATWNIMINGFANVGKPDEAFLFFKKMQSVGESISMKSLTSLLSGCASISDLKSGKEIHGYVIRTSFNKDEFVSSAVINMYMKCCQTSWAFLVFNQFEIKPKDPVIWNAMISGYGRNGESDSAFKIFELMQLQNVKPNSSTFNCILTVCSHTGKVEKGLEFFNLMKRYKLIPSSENYGCVIDMLGRSGRIEEARDLLLESEVSGSVLASLIGACKFHSDVKVGEEIARLLADLDPKSVTPFVILSSIYAGEGRWKDVEELRNEMDRKRLKKIRGFSSVCAG